MGFDADGSLSPLPYGPWLLARLPVSNRPPGLRLGPGPLQRRCCTPRTSVRGVRRRFSGRRRACRRPPEGASSWWDRARHRHVARRGTGDDRPGIRTHGRRHQPAHRMRHRLHQRVDHHVDAVAHRAAPAGSHDELPDAWFGRGGAVVARGRGRRRRRRCHGPLRRCRRHGPRDRTRRVRDGPPYDRWFSRA